MFIDSWKLSLPILVFQVLSQSEKEKFASRIGTRTRALGSKRKLNKSSTGKRKDRGDEAYIPNMEPDWSVRRDEKEIKVVCDFPGPYHEQKPANIICPQCLDREKKDVPGISMGRPGSLSYSPICLWV